MHIALTQPESVKEDATVDPAGIYAEDRWLPVLGPTPWLLARRVAYLARNGAHEIDDDELAAQLGVARSTLWKAAARLARLGLGQWQADDRTFVLYERWTRVPTRLTGRARRRAYAAKHLRSSGDSAVNGHR